MDDKDDLSKFTPNEVEIITTVATLLDAAMQLFPPSGEQRENIEKMLISWRDNGKGAAIRGIAKSILIARFNNAVDWPPR